LFALIAPIFPGSWDNVENEDLSMERIGVNKNLINQIMQLKTRKVIGRAILIIGVVSIFLSSVFHISDLFFWLTGLISLIYLFGGWYYFRGYYPEGETAFLFCLGYIYSSFFMGSAFATSDIELLRSYLPWSIILIIVLGVAFFFGRKKYQKGIKPFLVEAGIIFILALIQHLLNKA
jgi:hypothetical protein